MKASRMFKRFLKGVAETVILVFVNPCHKCAHENDCEFVGYCGDSGPSFYKRREEESMIKEVFE